MPIQANFNKLVYLKKFNNYFNRKIYGGNLNDYYYGESGASQTITVKFKISDLTEYNPHGVSILKTVLDILPFGILIDNVSVSFENLGAVDFSFISLAKQNPDKKSVVLLFDDNSDSESDFSDDFRIVFTYTFINREYYLVEDINFNPNDGVVSQLVGNNVPFDPDYLLVLDSETEEIVSRWFVIKRERVRDGQYQYALKRDVIFDNLQNLLNSPIYVHKGMLEENDPFVVNNEGMVVNQIKTNETRLVDKSEISWLVLYLAKNTPDTTAQGETVLVNAKISGTKIHTDDASYDIAVIPYYYNYKTFKDIEVIKPDGTTFTSSSYYVLCVLEKLIQQLDANCYDVQLLPYCPLASTLITNSGQIDLRQLANSVENRGFNYMDLGGTACGVVIYVDTASFQCDLHAEGNVQIKTNLTKKESSNLQLFRFVSPNYQGTFDFNIGKNNNVIENIKAYCTYKPYTPYLRIAPQFYAFYGNEFNDCRGLICGGDFSMPKNSDAWETYQLENKNYQNIFNREIQNLEFNQNLEMRNQIISAVVGHFTATATGAVSGAVVGGWVGAIIGGAVAGTTSLVSGIVDSITLSRRQREEKALQIDKFNYQLGNIQALPYTLTKIGAFDYSSKIFPFIEEYNCTSIELEAFRQKIKYESMTVLRIDTLFNYYNKFEDLCYFKGELIRNEQIASDNYIYEAIYAEFLKGVYI